jgi:predicted nucleotidyltransferase
MDLEHVKRVCAETLRADSSVWAAWIFGSAARGTLRAESDIDLAILRSAPPQTLNETAFELEDTLTRALGRRVQVVELASAPDDLTHRVMRDGILVLDRDRSARIAFEVAARNRYFDMTPIWRRYRGVESRR